MAPKMAVAKAKAKGKPAPKALAMAKAVAKAKASPKAAPLVKAKAKAVPKAKGRPKAKVAAAAMAPPGKGRWFSVAWDAEEFATSAAAPQPGLMLEFIVRDDFGNDRGAAMAVIQRVLPVAAGVSLEVQCFAAEDEAGRAWCLSRLQPGLHGLHLCDIMPEVSPHPAGGLMYVGRWRLRDPAGINGDWVPAAHHGFPLAPPPAAGGSGLGGVPLLGGGAAGGAGAMAGVHALGVRMVGGGGAAPGGLGRGGLGPAASGALPALGPAPATAALGAGDAVVEPGKDNKTKEAAEKRRPGANRARSLERFWAPA